MFYVSESYTFNLRMKLSNKQREELNKHKLLLGDAIQTINNIHKQLVKGSAGDYILKVVKKELIREGKKQ